MHFKDIDLKELFQLMQAHEVSDLNLKDGKITIEIKRNGGRPYHPLLQNPSTLETTSPHPQSPSGAPNGIQENQFEGNSDAPHDQKNNRQINEQLNTPQSPGEIAQNDFYTVIAPLVGTFYESPSPDSDPFVAIDDPVKKGDVICIVEAMKSMNEIQSDVDGIIKEICVGNAELVEFEQPLFKIDTKN